MNQDPPAWGESEAEMLDLLAWGIYQACYADRPIAGFEYLPPEQQRSLRERAGIVLHVLRNAKRGRVLPPARPL